MPAHPHASGAPRGRLDALLVERGLARSPERAQSLVAAGLVEVDGRAATSAAQRVAQTVNVRIIGRDHPWASRAGLKLDGALRDFGVECADRVVLDAGASTGGFVSVLLERGARLVYAVDVGHGQLLSQLASDPRVVVMDRTNLRTLETLDGETPTLVTLDLSFISLRAVVPALRRIAPGAEVVALFKPQFELPRERIGEGGIVADPAESERAADDFLAWVCQQGGAGRGVPQPAAVKGTKGNQEWVVHFDLGETR